MRVYPLLAAALFALRLSTAAPVLPFPQANSDLPPDPAARFGALPNGMRYVILPNHEPRDRVSLRLLVLSGSLEERDDQRGLAHYLEHMAFNGSTHYPPNTLVKYFQRMGMNFGGDTNAHTGFDRTIYQINLPHSDDATLAEGLQVFSDFAGGLLLTPEMVDKERPIILSEKRTGDSVQYRESVALFKFALADSLFSRRLVIGEKSDIDQATREQFVDIYNSWYRPERMAVVVVGEVDPARVEKQIAEAFGKIGPRAPARPDPDLGHITAALGLKTFYHYETEAPVTLVELVVIAPYSYRPDDSAMRRNHLIRRLATDILTRRLAILSKKEGAPFIVGGAAATENFNAYRYSAVYLNCAAGQWQPALAAGEQELRKALQFGFTAAELREAVADERKSYRQAAESAATRRSEELAEEVADLLADKTVLTHPVDDFARANKVLDGVTPEDCVEALRYAFGTPGRYVMVMGNARIDGDANAAIAAAYQSSSAVAIQPPGAASAEGFAYTDFGTPGKIVSRTHVEDLDITQVAFANGVRANLKKTDFEANRIRVLVRVGAGNLTARRDQPGLWAYAEGTFVRGALRKHSQDDLHRILAGKSVGISFSMGSDAFVFTSGATTRDSLLVELQLLAASVTDPGFRPEAGRYAAQFLDAAYNQLERTPQGILSLEVPTLLTNGDSRFGLPPRAVELSRTLDEEKAWLAPQFATGPIEISIVGDFETESALDFVAGTFGALAPRAPKPDYAEERRIQFPAQVFSKEYTIKSEIPKALVALYWPTTDSRDVRRARRLQMLTAVFDDRLRIKIREQLGDAYYVATRNVQEEVFPGYGCIEVTTTVAPDRTKDVTAAILAVAADLQANGVTAEEFERAKKPALTSLRDSARTNPYWLRQVLASCQEFPRHLDWARTRLSDVEEMKADDLSALARTYLAPERAFRVKVSPEDASSRKAGQ